MRKILVSVVALFVLVAGVFLLNSQAIEAGGGKTVFTTKVDWGHQESDGWWASSIWMRSSPSRDVQQFVYFRPGVVPSGVTKQVDENGTVSTFAANNHIYKAVGFQLMEPGGSRSFLRTYWNGESELGPEFRYSRTAGGDILVLGVNKTGRTLFTTTDGGSSWQEVATQEWTAVTTRADGELHFYDSPSGGEIAYIAWTGNIAPATATPTPTETSTPTPTATTTPTPTAMPTMTPTPTATPAPISPIIESVSSYTAAPGDVVIIRGRNFNKADNSDLSNLMVWLVHDDGGVATLASVIPRVGDVMWEENAITFRIGPDRPPQSGRLLVLAYNRWGEAPERFTIVNKPTPTPTAIPLGLQVNTKRIDVTIQAGSSAKALAVTSTGANGFQFYGYPTKYGPGINWNPWSGRIANGESIDIAIQVGSNVPPGTYNGTGTLMNLTGQRTEIPVTVKVTKPFRPILQP